jgi:hypothetical protein
VAARPSSLGEQAGEAKHPPVDGDMVDLDAALREQFLDVAVGQPKAQVPADRQDDDVGRGAEASEGRPASRSRERTAGSHTISLAARTRSQRMQQPALGQQARIRSRRPVACTTMTGPTVRRQIPHMTAAGQPTSGSDPPPNPGPSSPNEPGGIFTANLKGVELANFAGDTVAEVADQAHHGIQRICDSDSLVVGFLAHTGLSLDDEPSP